ncbi:MAG: hypothetical protein JWQ81_8280 [Amycolatopsis sp.]|uniref:hypothetical protein n=1 Tax=Amycolatopsis sp. TaxID=37632 RepID=UPI00261A6528|nr:hypothetical protein [Amycolatopsis sp.]MCU1687541.1 hypothetical protein [Amycolatopsis sp.]
MTTLDDTQRATLAALADGLIPAGVGMPCASEVSVAGSGVDYVLSVRPDLVEPLLSALGFPDAATEPDQALAALRAEQPSTFAALGEIVAGAYFLDKSVQDRIGYHGRVAAPADLDSPVDPDLLRPVIARGPIYRPDPRNDGTFPQKRPG